MPHSLHCVGVKDYSSFFSNFSYLAYRLYGAYLIVGVHHRNKDGLVSDGLLDILRVNQSILIYGKVGYSESPFLQKLTGLYHSVMLDGSGNDVISCVFIGIGNTLYSKVVCLCPPAGKHNFLTLGINKAGDLVSCFFNSFSCFLAIGIRS